MSLAKDIRIQIIEVQLISLKARKEKAKQFAFNIDLQLECKLLESQIEALEAELKTPKEDCQNHYFDGKPCWGRK